jgi:transcriptional regulator with XRE-family HTH domain
MGAARMNAHTQIDARTPDAVDIHVGARVRFRRRELGMTQQQLADASNVSFQQIQKYENGNNRVSASRLVQLAAALQIPVGWFFEDIEFPKTHDGYRRSVWSDTLQQLADLGGLELARALIGLQPAQLVLMTKLGGELASLNAKAERKPRKAA